MRRLVVALMVAAVMAAMGLVGPITTLGTTSAGPPASSAIAQVPGQPTCGPWQIAWYVSEGGW